MNCIIKEDITEGTLELEEHRNDLSNLDITNKKWDSGGNQIRITLHCK